MLSIDLKNYTSFSIANLLIIICAILLSIPIISLFLSWLPIADKSASSNLNYNVILQYSLNSIIICVFTGFFCVVIGVGLAWVVTMYNFPCKKLISWALILPFAIPSYIAAMIYGFLLEGAGPIQEFIREKTGLEYGDYWFIQIRSISGVIFILTFTLYPYVYIIARSAFLSQSRQMIEVARSLGESNFSIIFKIAIPLARPAIITGLALVVMESISDFGVVSLYGVPSFTTGIYSIWNGFYDPIGASRLASILLIFVLMFLWIEKKSRGKASFENSSSAHQPLEITNLSGFKATIAFILLIIPIIAGFIVPLIFILKFSLSNFAIFKSPNTWNLVFSSIKISLIVATFATLIGLIFAYFLRSKKSFLQDRIIKIATLGYAIPGSVIAIGTLLFLVTLQNDILGGKIFLTGSILGVVWGCSLRFLTISFNNSEAGLSKIPVIMDHVGKSLGLNKFSILWLIHRPMLKASLVSSFILIFIDTIKELPATLLLRPFNFNSLAIKTYELAKDDLLPYAAPTALLLIVVSIAPVLLLASKLSRS